MCLDRLMKAKPAPTGVGWKVYNILNRKLSGEDYSFKGERKYSNRQGSYTPYIPESKWLRASNGKIWAGQFNYERGFHIYTNKSAAKAESYCYQAVVKVRYKSAHCQGDQNHHRVVVAKWLYVYKTGL